MATKSIAGSPGTRVPGIGSDGSSTMNAQALETAMRLKCDPANLLLRDEACGAIHRNPADMGDTHMGKTRDKPDVMMLARAHATQGHCLVDAEEFLPTQ